MNTFLAETGSTCKPSNSHYHVGMCNLGRVLTLSNYLSNYHCATGIQLINGCGSYTQNKKIGYPYKSH